MNQILFVLLICISCKSKPQIDYLGKMEALERRTEVELEKIRFEGEMREKLFLAGIKGERAEKYIDSITKEMASDYNSPTSYMNPYISDDSARKLKDSIFGK